MQFNIIFLLLQFMPFPDLLRQLKRRNVPYRTLEVPIKKTLTAMRLLAAIPDNSIRAGLSHALYRVIVFKLGDYKV